MSYNQYEQNAIKPELSAREININYYGLNKVSNFGLIIIKKLLKFLHINHELVEGYPSQILRCQHGEGVFADQGT